MLLWTEFPPQVGEEDQVHGPVDFSYALFADDVLLEPLITDLSVGQFAVKCKAVGQKISNSKSETIVLS